MDILLLTTPSQHTSDNPAVELDPKQLEKWIKSLPVKDVLTTVARLQVAIDAFNQVKLRSSARIKLLEIYFQAFQDILYFYDGLRVKQLSITPKQQQELLEDIMWLYLALSKGYKIIIRHANEGTERSRSDSTVILAIFRALELISSSIVFAFRSQVEVPPLAYLEAHQLYLFAEKFEAHTMRIKSIKGYRDAPTVDKIYKQLMLVSVANRDEISPSEFQELYMYLEPFSQLCYITTNSEGDDSSIEYTIDLMEDNRPHYKANAAENASYVAERIFNITPALEVIQFWCQEHAGNEDSSIFENEVILLNKFLMIVKSIAHQPSSFVTDNVSYKLIAGLSSVIKLLLPPTKRLAMQSAISIVNIKMDGTDKLILAVDPENKQTISEPGSIIAVLGAKTSTSNSVFMAGIIRTTRAINDMHEVQVNILSRQAVPVSYFIQNNDRHKDTHYEGLYFPKDNDHNKNATLFVEKANVDLEKKIQVSIQNKTFLVEAMDIVRETAHYVQFRFSVVKNK